MLATWRSWLLLIVVAVVLGSKLLTAYVIPSGSMERALLVSDYLHISKLPLNDPNLVRRNGVVVFRAPCAPLLAAEQRPLLIKRCVAVAGDTLAIRQG